MSASDVVTEVSLSDVVAVVAGTRAERPVPELAVVVTEVSVASAATVVVAVTLLAAAGDTLRELTFPPDEETALLRAECAVVFFAVAESLAVEDAELLSEPLEDALPAPDPAPVSA
ncbi:hypothetical protein ORI20_17385 [Mycobacterium sp. CVI_P3]|uniref:Uncharacterized protein n=1 Tax=Mycobacterium pinniadriaticum TaxID=2994102 RepID=A0ABT3SG35_9MYCO|nr:hypothetical protein [Mycobacterium pinniadriaticum]MCX2932053.1 hypothetical protein [Mycobacterium pinniadriaticum]MCX2938477.1 hypothetical protein [Mycobacterium pinniadriaticum]